MKVGNRKIEISCFFVYTRVLKANSKFFQKVRVTTLTQGGLRALSDLEELKRERGNSEYYRVSQSIWQRQSDISDCTCNCSNVFSAVVTVIYYKMINRKQRV